MNKSFRLFPEQASASAEEMDMLYLFLVANAFFFTALICVLILFFAVRYRRGAKVNRKGAPHGNLGLELLWSFIPLTIMMISFGWGARLFVDAYSPPPHALDVYVVGKQWMWKIQHEEGRQEINELHVPVGQPVRLQMISEDVIHSFFVPAFRTKQDVLPGRYTQMWFEANKPGEYHLFCAEYCGTSHSQMRGRVVAMEAADYAEWVSGNPEEPAASVGARLFERYRCESCHGPENTERGPSLVNLIGSMRTLKSGGQVKADLAYLRESIRHPGEKLVAGYENRMPSYEITASGQEPLSEEQILQLIAYLETLQK